ncbi:hypothetical protein GWK08_11810 [Leptobacterium flavescens]|uniref:Letm1 RBD domain-containing protein n=1 Tax=Leptobacterium flavescens TaxID=472055 RepID=A0A6P0UNW4_9FLAO|nr:LETM1-related biofilm-associated protein [Leptobacterium flavescens]NER14130.1 hypothetical protein [Leptobacterium flavescens]
MNPSANGWIDKMLALLEEDSFFQSSALEKKYHSLRSSGFIYGTNLQTIFDTKSDNKLTETEITKINLLLSLLHIYHDNRSKGTDIEAIDSILDFYAALQAKKFTFLERILTGNHCSAQLEKVIQSRVRTNVNIFTKNFSNIITNALLFIDILAYDRFLKGEEDVVVYAQNIEIAITNIILRALNSKEKKSDYDELLIRLVESSLRYHEVEPDKVLNDRIALLSAYTSVLERFYILDLASMAVWNDAVLNKREEHFLWDLGRQLRIDDKEIAYSLSYIHGFINLHKKEISFFNYSNPVKHFYDQSAKTVSKLILRNRKRLLKELSESKELAKLLTKSTVKDLSEAEKQKMREQLIDICKTVPSLAIFVLPGGSVLLPLLIQFIPKLLPSAFDDNRIPDK